MSQHQSVVLWSEADGWHYERQGGADGVERGTLEASDGDVDAAKRALAARLGAEFVWAERRYADTVAHVGLPEALAADIPDTDGEIDGDGDRPSGEEEADARHSRGGRGLLDRLRRRRDTRD